MYINGVNSSNNFKVSTPLKKKYNPSFSGQVLTQDERGNDIYKFNLPNAPENAKIQLVVLSKDKNGYYKPSQESVTYDMPKGSDSFVVKASDFKLDNDNLLGYKFIIDKKEYTDKGVKSDGGYTIAIPVTNPNSTRPRQMEHVLVDSFNVDNPAYAKRNHFNMLGGTLESFNEKVNELAQSGVRNVLGTPIFGQCNKSSHGYWTTNPYQITQNLGDIKDFRDLMVNLYKHNMSWTADGAFVNEGMEGIHIMDIINFGTESPFLPMFETKDVKNIPIRFGVFSKNEDVNRHLHIKLVNAPYKITFEKDGDVYKEAQIKPNRVDSSKPTYIQVFDDRLASENQMNSDEIFNVYDNKEALDRNEIAGYRDSAQTYHFKVTPAEVKINYEKFKENKKSGAQFKDALTSWTNFRIVNSNKDGGVSLWVGNSDISKKRFVLSDYALNAMHLSGDEKAQAAAAQYQVQDDTVQVGKFWTSTVSKMLTEYTAKELADKVSSGNISYQQAIEQLINENKLPAGAKVVFEKSDKDKPSALDNILKFSPVTGERKYHLKPVTMPQNITDGMMSYPYEAIEFGPDLVSVFAYPFIKNLAVSEETVGKSRYEMYQMGDSYYSQMPERYRKIYKKTDAVLAGQMTDSAKSILTDLQSKTGQKLLENDELTTLGREIYSIIYPDIAKFLMVSALAPQLKPLEDDSMLAYDTKELNKIDFNKLNLQYELSPEDVALSLLNKIQDGLRNIPSSSKEKFVESLAKRVGNINSDAINVAKLIVEKTESGLDWRIDAAKDVGDYESKEANKMDSGKNINAILSFWSKFNKGVRENNPRSYIIGELTDADAELKDKKPMDYNDYVSLSQFIQRTGFSTVSDYSFFYNPLAQLYGQDSEGKNNNSATSVIGNAFGDNAYFASGIMDNFNFAHRFVGNQDKPRILHLLATNVKAFNEDKGREVQKVIQKGFEASDVYKNLSEDNKNAIKTATERLKKGIHKVDGQDKPFDAENFGIRPFDFTIEDIVNEAIQTNKNFENFAKSNPEQVEKLKAETLKNILFPAMKKYQAIMFAMVGLPGNPTNYAGDEFGMTGWETFCKNEKQENRNALRWDWLTNPNYKFINEHKNQISKIMNIRNKEAASALVNGATQPLHNQDIVGGGQAAAFYRYNDKTDAIVVLHSNGYGPNPDQSGGSATLSSIKLDGLGFTLQEGTIYVNALDESQKYKVCKDNVVKRIDAGGNEQGSIDLGNSGIILLREKDFKGNNVSFKGRIENPHVKLANTKYNFNYMTK